MKTMTPQFKEKDQKYLDALINLYEELQAGNSYTPTNMVRDYNLCADFSKKLVTEKIVLRTRVGKGYYYEWNSIRPNRQMVAKLMDLVRRARSERDSNSKKGYNKKNTGNCLEFLLETYFNCKNKEKGFLQPLYRSYHMASSTPTVLRDYGYIRRINGSNTYEWIKEFPTEKTANQFELDKSDFYKKSNNSHIKFKEVQNNSNVKNTRRTSKTTITKSYFFGLFKITKTT